MSWWLNLPRADFAREIGRRFAVNRADPKHGGYSKPESREAKARKGGQRKAQRFGVNVKLRDVPERKSA